ncbi:MAG: type II CAAX endopeptidase family protein [Cyanobacteria bacterium P01_C01_bin.73]
MAVTVPGWGIGAGVFMVQVNPFKRLKTRLLLMAFIAIGAAAGLLLSILDALGVLPFGTDDPLLIPLIYILVFGGVCATVLWQGRPNLRLSALMGNFPGRFSWPFGTALTVCLLMFSMGAFQVSYYLLSFVQPTWVEGTLQEAPAIFAPAETVGPGVYGVMIVLSIVVVAPLAEEFIFRGILLHRWQTKWGTPFAVISSSLFFGMLHPNPVGLSVFGVVMALLYLQTRSLWVPIFCHGLNNLLTIGLEVWATQVSQDNPVDTLAEFRDNWWIGLIFIAVAAPVLVRYISRTWRYIREPLPYFVNVAAKSPGGQLPKDQFPNG